MSEKKIEVSVLSNKCLGYGICLSLPEVFDLPAGTTVATVNASEFDESLLADIEEAAKNCPAGAIQYRVVETA